MRPAAVKNRGTDHWHPTRRELLGAAAGATVGLLCGLETGHGQPPSPAASRPAPARDGCKPWWLERDQARSRVVEARSHCVLRASIADQAALGDMLEQGIQNLTGAATTVQAWQAVLGRAERVVLKFNAVGARVINTTEAMARTLVDQLAQAGFEPGAITLVEAPAFLAGQLGTRPVVPGWGPAIPVGGRLEPLTRYLHEADAIVNVAFLKTHQIAGMSACMKNLSHALIRHPAWYHANGCAPYVGQVVGSPEVSSRLRLNIVNAIRVVVDRGPEARKEDLIEFGGLLLGFDPVAVDHVAISLLAAERRRLGLPDLSVPYLAAAAGMGLGRWRPTDIDRAVLEVDT